MSLSNKSMMVILFFVTISCSSLRYTLPPPSIMTDTSPVTGKRTAFTTSTRITVTESPSGDYSPFLQNGFQLRFHWQSNPSQEQEIGWHLQVYTNGLSRYSSDYVSLFDPSLFLNVDGQLLEFTATQIPDFDSRGNFTQRWISYATELETLRKIAYGNSILVELRSQRHLVRGIIEPEAIKIFRQFVVRYSGGIKTYFGFIQSVNSVKINEIFNVYRILLNERGPSVLISHGLTLEGVAGIG